MMMIDGSVRVCMCDVGLQVSITGLERELHHYTLEPTETAFDLKSVPLAAQPLLEQPAATPGEAPAVKATEKIAATRQDVYAGLCCSMLHTE